MARKLQRFKSFQFEYPRRSRPFVTTEDIPARRFRNRSGGRVEPTPSLSEMDGTELAMEEEFFLPSKPLTVGPFGHIRC